MMCTRTKFMSIPMDRIRHLRTRANVLSGATVGLCLLLFIVGALSGRSQNGTPTQGGPQRLDKADLLGLLDCATRPDQLLAVRSEFYDADGLHMRYVYPVVPGHEANMLNSFAEANWVAIVLYHKDERSAALFEVGFDGPPSRRTFTLLDGANLVKKETGWAVKDILNGGVSTWPEIARHVEQASTKSMVTISRADVTRTNAACEFPKRKLEFVAVSPSGDKSNWKFKDGVSEGIRFKSQNGPFNNSDLKRVPYTRVFMNSYGPS